MCGVQDGLDVGLCCGTACQRAAYISKGEIGRRYVPSCDIAFDSCSIACASCTSARSRASSLGTGKSTGTTFESAKEQRTKSACRKRTCWYATRRGQNSVSSEVCAPRAGSAKSAVESVWVASGVVEGWRMKSSSYTPMSRRRM